jgi:hypothetical protein
MSGHEIEINGEEYTLWTDTDAEGRDRYGYVRSSDPYEPAECSLYSIQAARLAAQQLADEQADIDRRENS